MRWGWATMTALLFALKATPAFAQSARANFLLQMLRSNPDARVRTNAALRLGELHERETLDALMTIFNAERDATVQATILAALASIGDARAMSLVQTATRNPSRDVQAQARRALGILQANANNNAGSTPANGTTPSAGGTPTVLVATGRINLQSGVPAALQPAAQRALESALDARSTIVRHSGTAAQARATVSSRHLRGAHQFDANVQSVTAQPNGVRVAVSIVVSTYPGHTYEFDASSTLTVSGGAQGQAGQEGALSQAIASAVNRAATQLLATP